VRYGEYALTTAGTPPSSSSSVYQGLLFETSTERVQELVSRYPAFSSALPRAAQTFRAMALSGSHVLVDDVGIALDDRPWEMIEQMVTVPVQRHPDLFLASKALKDTASIPIALFRPQLTRDEVPEAVEDKDDSRPWENSAAERNLGNGFAGEPVAVRQTATILFARDDGSAVADEETLTIAMPAVPAKIRRLSTRIPVSAAKQSGLWTRSPSTLTTEATRRKKTRRGRRLSARGRAQSRPGTSGDWRQQG
jgi:mediator of RNA polymerase II transcription subunit 12